MSIPKRQPSRPDIRQHQLSTRWSLIQRLRDANDHEGWQEFFECYWNLIYSTAVRSGLSEPEAQDAVQETVISVCRNIHQLNMSPEAGSFKAWLMTTARWRITDQIRRRHPAVQMQMRETAADRPEEDLADPAGPDLERVWDEEWKRNLTDAALARVQRQTSARHFQIFYLHVVQGMPVVKVAAATGASADEVYLIKHRLHPLFDKAVRSVEAGLRA